MLRARQSRAVTSHAPWSPVTGIPVAGEWTNEQSVRYVVQTAMGHYENFPVAFTLFDRHVVEALSAIYAFARTADDFADEPAFKEKGLDYLDDWQRQLEDCFDGRSTHPVFIALARARQQFQLEIEPFQDLISAFRQDAAGFRYDTYPQVLDYCSRSANPVGRLVLRVLGLDSDKRLIKASDELCTALQLTNFWQDLSVDLPRGRVYVPGKDMDAFSLSPDDLLIGRQSYQLENLLIELTSRVFPLYENSRVLPRLVSFPASLYLSMVWRGGFSVLQSVCNLKAGIFRKRPKLSQAARLKVLLLSIADLAS